MQLPAAPVRPRKMSAGSSPDQQSGHQNKAPAFTPSAPHSKALKGGSEIGCSHRQAGTPATGSVAVRVTGTKSSKSPGDSPAHVHDLDKPPSDAHVQSQALVHQDQQSGGNAARTSGTADYGHGQQALDINSVTTALDQQQPLSAGTPGKPLPGTPAVNGHKSTRVPAANRTPAHAVSDVAKRNTNQAPQSVVSEHASKHEPVAESPGIITSATIARLVSHSAAQQPLNGKSSTRLHAPPSRGRVQATPPHTAAGKRKRTDTHQLPPDSSGQGGQSIPILPSSQASSPSSSSPDQPAAGKRKKIMWDPQVALSRQAIGAPTAQTQQLPPSDSLQPPAPTHAQTHQSVAPSTSLVNEQPPGSSLVQPPNSTQLSSQKEAQAADKQVDKQNPRQEEVGRSAGRGTKQTGPEVGVVWSWGPGAAVQGQFDAALISMMSGSVGDQKPGSKGFLNLLEWVHTPLHCLYWAMYALAEQMFSLCSVLEAVRTKAFKTSVLCLYR